jgi:YHS domain-containing protein
MIRFLTAFACLALTTSIFADEPAKVDPRQALQGLQTLVAPWKGTGTPDGSREERQKFWTEMDTWVWQFKDGDAFLSGKFDGGRYFTHAELRAIGKDRFRFTAESPTKEKLVFEGELKDNKLTLDRTDDKTKETQRLTFRLLHSNRVVYQYETRADGKTLFTRKYQVGMTNQSEPFAGAGSSEPECVVSGGKGTIPVTYKGTTYYVCCSGCRDEFKSNPEKYIAEYEARKKEKNGKKQ